ncbi:MAG: hypothetical protein ACM3SY_18855 [Candidatus Omnitrophota bacterium]
MTFKDDKRQYEYEHLLAYEIELTKSRWTVFAALFSVSLLIPVIALKDASHIQALEPWAKYAIALGFLVFLTASYHYWWYHRISHRIRNRLKEIEELEDITIIRIRKRPELFGCIRIHFHWMLLILAIAYAFLTSQIVGPILFLYFIGVLALAFVALAIIYNIKTLLGKKDRNL